VKNATAYAKKLATLLRKIKPKSSSQPPDDVDPITRLVIGFLQWNATARSAAIAHGKLMAELVDNNDLRVSYVDEVVALIGPRYPQAFERAARLRDAMNVIYEREHATSLDALRDRAKKDIRTYLDTLPGITPYVVAHVLLVAFGGHAIPVDDKLALCLKAQQVVDDTATVEQITAFLERHVKAEDAMQTHLALQAWADKSRISVEKALDEPVLTKTTQTVKIANKTTKKKTSKRTTAKKRTTKRTSKKTAKARSTKRTTKRTTKR